MKLSFSLFLIVYSTLSNAKSPSVTLRYSYIFDSWCSSQNGIAITQPEMDRLEAIIPALQAEWNKLGPILVAKTEAYFKKDFLQNEMIGTVFLCKRTPSLSMPLLINANWFVNYPLETPDRAVDIILHELIHTYLDDNFPSIINSPLFTKYKNEGGAVLAHLHLMAIQKKIYLELGLTDRIQDVIKFDSEKYSGIYKRSWEIVNSEGEDKFVEELK